MLRSPASMSPAIKPEATGKFCVIWDGCARHMAVGTFGLEDGCHLRQGGVRRFLCRQGSPAGLSGNQVNQRHSKAGRHNNHA